MRGWLLAAPGVFLAAAFFRPLFATLGRADASAWRWALTHPLVHDRLLGAMWMSLLSVVLTLAIAVPLAWSHHRRGGGWRNVHMAFHAAPFVLPVFVIVFGVQATLGHDGWTDRWLGLDLLAMLGPMAAVAIAHAYYNYGFAARLIHATLERRPHRLEDAARLLGASPRQAFMRTTLPILAPSLAAVALLVFLFSFTSFGVVLYLGDGVIATLEVLLYENLRGAFPQVGRAAALGVMQLVLNFALLAGYMALIRRQANMAREPARPAASRRFDHARSLLGLSIAMAPLVAVLAGGFRVQREWSLAPWRALLDAQHPAHVAGFSLTHALGLSLMYALASAAIALALSLGLAYGVKRLNPLARRLAEIISALPLGTSSLLIGFGLILSTSVAFVADSGRGRLLIIAAHALVAFPFTGRVLLPAVAQLDRRLDEAAALLGASTWSTFRRVHLPLLAAPIVAAVGLAIAMSFGDFGASLLLMNADNRGISVWIDAIGGNAQFNPIIRAQSMALAGLLMLMTAAAYTTVEWIAGRPAWR